MNKYLRITQGLIKGIKNFSVEDKQRETNQLGDSLCKINFEEACPREVQFVEKSLPSC